tara:strand:+ start:524 stop:1156 length:633 start_codon:yes stop_codon:yes gene_type:complete
LSIIVRNSELGLKIHTQTHDYDGFIKGWYFKDTSLCDKIINWFEEYENTHDQETIGINFGFKDSTDIQLDLSTTLYQEYMTQLRQVTELYLEQFPSANAYDPFGVLDATNIQRYTPSQGFHSWHTERRSAKMPGVTRHLVFMTYLNDISDEGETEWKHQGLKVKPEKGLTVIWPADWTYTHKGIPSHTETKYIATGWYNFFIEGEESNGN